MTIAKVQHYVPQFLLRNFGNGKKDQVWVYDKTSYEYHKESGYFTVLFAGAGGDRVRSSSRSTLLTIYFDQSDRVVDYRLRAIKY